MEDRWQERHKFYAEEILKWSHNRQPVSQKDIYQNVNSSVGNAINSEVGKMTTSKDIRQSFSQISVFYSMGSCTKWCHGGKDENYAWAKRGLTFPQVDPATATALCLICHRCKHPIIKYPAQGPDSYLAVGRLYWTLSEGHLFGMISRMDTLDFDSLFQTTKCCQQPQQWDY